MVLHFGMLCSTFYMVQISKSSNPFYKSFGYPEVAWGLLCPGWSTLCYLDTVRMFIVWWLLDWNFSPICEWWCSNTVVADAKYVIAQLVYVLIFFIFYSIFMFYFWIIRRETWEFIHLIAMRACYDWAPNGRSSQLWMYCCCWNFNATLDTW